LALKRETAKAACSAKQFPRIHVLVTAAQGLFRQKIRPIRNKMGEPIFKRILRNSDGNGETIWKGCRINKRSIGNITTIQETEEKLKSQRK
jgi:hypothetical protein